MFCWACVISEFLIVLIVVVLVSLFYFYWNPNQKVSLQPFSEKSRISDSTSVLRQWVACRRAGVHEGPRTRLLGTFAQLAGFRSRLCTFRPMLLEEADDQLFKRILNYIHHTLYQLLPPQSTASQKYNLRRRTHDRQLHDHQGHLSDCNFITRLLYRNSY